jgi:hypothetical protein
VPLEKDTNGWEGCGQHVHSVIQQAGTVVAEVGVEHPVHWVGGDADLECNCLSATLLDDFSDTGAKGIRDFAQAGRREIAGFPAKQLSDRIRLDDVLAPDLQFDHHGRVTTDHVTLVTDALNIGRPAPP